MNKNEFLAALGRGLSGLPQDDIAERITFYGEMIDDKVEEGIKEEDAVAQLGDVDSIIKQILLEIPITRIVRERVKPKRSLKAWEIVLIILGFPVWFPLTVSAVAVLFSLYVTICALIASLWAVFISFVAMALSGLVLGIISVLHGSILEGIALIGLFIMFCGFSILMFLGCISAVKGLIVLTKKTAVWIKSLFIKKESSE